MLGMKRLKSQRSWEHVSVQTITLLPTTYRPLGLTVCVVGTETCFAHKQQPLLVSGVQGVKHWHCPVVSASTVNVVFSVDVS